MTLTAPDAAPALPGAFTVHLPVFQGSLLELASALRAGRILPAEVPLLDITTLLLTHVREWQHVTDTSELLPPLAGVIALKARLLLPQPEPEFLPDFTDDGDLDGFIEQVETLAELDLLVQFLGTRRRERQHLIAAKPIDLGLPRKARKASPAGLQKLLTAARNAVRDVTVPLLARERLTLRDALHALRTFAGRLGRFSFHAVPTQDWAERTTYFSALLEGVKAGDFDADQQDAYGLIDIQVRAAQAVVDGVDDGLPEALAAG